MTTRNAPLKQHPNATTFYPIKLAKQIIGWVFEKTALVFIRIGTNLLRIVDLLKDDALYSQNKVLFDKRLEHDIFKTKKKLARTIKNKEVCEQLYGFVEAFHWPTQSLSYIVISEVDNYRLNMMMGNPVQGTLHSFIRHCTQWRIVSAQIDQLWLRLPDAVKQLIKSVETQKESANNFFALALAAEPILNPYALFNEIEEEMYRFILENTSFLKEVKKTVLCFSLETNRTLWEDLTAINSKDNSLNWDLVLAVPELRNTDFALFAGKTHQIVTAYFQTVKRKGDKAKGDRSLSGSKMQGRQEGSKSRSRSRRQRGGQRGKKEEFQV